MSDDQSDSRHAMLFIFLIFITAFTGTIVVAGDSLETDRHVLLKLKSFLEERNHVNRGKFKEWNQHNSTNPCDWAGILCTPDKGRVNGINLCCTDITGEIYPNFSSLTQLSHLDLSKNTLYGAIPDDLSRCGGLKYLNLSHNILEGELNMAGLNSLEILDLSVNRIHGGIQMSFQTICERLIVAIISANNFTGRIDDCFQNCWNLQYLDLSSNNFGGEIWMGFARLKQFSVSENYLTGAIGSSIFDQTCSLQVLDLSENNFVGEVPKEISNCSNLVILNLWGNNFTGQIPAEIGNISTLEGLYLGNNTFSSQIPESLLGLSNLAFLDLSRNSFEGEIQEIFGKLTQVKFLVLHGNSYTGGINSSGILKLPNISRLDLSYNKFSGPLPVEISQMLTLKFLILAFNQFDGRIPPEYGNLPLIQALDLSFNRLTGSIPPSLGNLRSLLWLMLADNSLTGEIPKELGNCSSLLWLNLANNRLSGTIPSELTNIGRNATPTFESNRQNDGVIAGSGECLAIKRWIPADYPPFSFVYTILTRKSCRSIWDRLLKGYGLFPICVAGSAVRAFQTSGYVQLCGNLLTGEVPREIGEMQNFSMLHLGFNQFYGNLPHEIGQLPLVVLNISVNKFSGEIPSEIGDFNCLQHLDLSYNNFSGLFPASFNSLTELSKFNISYNPLISGIIPFTGQLATFAKNSFLGDPHLLLPSFIDNSTDKQPDNSNEKPRKHTKWALHFWSSFGVSFFLSSSFFFFFFFFVVVPRLRWLFRLD